MSQAEGGNFRIEPGQHDVAAFAPLLARPELAAGTTGALEAIWTLPSVVDLGRAAVRLGGVEAYDGWQAYADGFAAGLRRRSPSVVDHGQVSGYLARLRYHGAAGGSIDAADGLHAMLDDDDAGQAMQEVMVLCARHDTPPHLWIEPHARTPDAAAAAWDTYLRFRRIETEREGWEAEPSDLLVTGADAYLHDFINGEHSDELAIRLGADTLRLAPDDAMRRSIYRRYTAVAGRMVQQDESALTPGLAVDILRFGTTVLRTAFGFDEHREIKRLVQDDLVEWTGVGYAAARAEFDIAAAIVAPAEMDAVAAIVDEAAATMSPGFLALRMRDRLLASAVDTYMHTGDADRAAAVLARIDDTTVWQAAMDSFARKGGHIGLALLADELRQIQEPLGGGHAQMAGGRPDWALRYATGLTLEALVDRDHEGAARHLQRVAEQASASGNPHGEFILMACERLLAEDPDSAAVGTSIIGSVRNITGFPYLRQLYTLFGAHGAAEVTSLAWDYTQRQTRTPVDYLSHYAGALLAQAGIDR